MTTNFLLTLGE